MVANEAVLWLSIQRTFDALDSSDNCLERLPLPFQDHLKFLLKEHLMFSVAAAVTRNLIKICSAVDSLLMSEELKHQEAIF
jgi:hypothetical protein